MVTVLLTERSDDHVTRALQSEDTNAFRREKGGAEIGECLSSEVTSKKATLSSSRVMARGAQTQVRTEVDSEGT